MEDKTMDEAKIIGKYKYWDIYDRLPDGFSIDFVTGSPDPRLVFIRTGSPLKAGYKRALMPDPRKKRVNQE